MQSWQPRGGAPVYGKQPVAGPVYGAPVGPGVRGSYPHPYGYRVQNSRYEYASFWRRTVAAFFVDPLIFLVLCLPGYLFRVIFVNPLPVSRAPDRTSAAMWISIFLSLLVTVGYPVLCTRLGGSPGYRAMDLRVTSREGTNPSLRSACLRCWPQSILLLYQLCLGGVVVLDLGNLSTSRRLVDTLGWAYLAVVGLSGAVWLLGCFLCIVDRHKQTLHDKLAGTYVIHIR